MSEKSQQQRDAIARFESDYFPTLEKGILSKDITRAMREDWKIILAEPEVGLAVSVAPAAPEIPPVNPFVTGEPTRDGLDDAALEKAVDFVGVREEQAPSVAKTGKKRGA
jgi:hypothetical protein